MATAQPHPKLSEYLVVSLSDCNFAEAAAPRKQQLRKESPKKNIGEYDSHTMLLRIPHITTIQPNQKAQTHLKIKSQFYAIVVDFVEDHHMV
eukprot:753414-Hanusia_phi.AAC.12